MNNYEENSLTELNANKLRLVLENLRFMAIDRRLQTLQIYLIMSDYMVLNYSLIKRSEPNISFARFDEQVESIVRAAEEVDRCMIHFFANQV